MSSTGKTIFDVTVQINPPNEATGYPGQVAEGKYTFIDNVVTLTDHAGNPVKNVHGKVCSQKIGPSENPRAIAARLTKQLALARRGKDRLDFGRVLNYPKLGWM